MKVTARQLSSVIEEIFDCQTTVVEDDNVVVFGMMYVHYKAQVCLRIFDKTVFEDQENKQGIAASFTFTDEDGVMLDMQGRPFDKLLDICNELQHAIDWGTAAPTKVRDGTVEVNLYRACNTSQEDLKRARVPDPNCELLTTLFELAREFEMLAPVLQGFHAETIVHPRHVRAIINPPASATTM